MKCHRTSAILLALGAAVLLGSTQQASARLGETEAQITALYGKPLEDEKPDKDGVVNNLYHKGNHLILVQLRNGVSIAEAYARMDSSKLAEKEISNFLQASSAGKTWNPQPGSKSAWERSDGAAQARLETLAGRPTLWIRARS